MASTLTASLLALEKQATGENENTWGTKLNTVLDVIDRAAAGYLAKSVAGAANVTLTQTESENLFIEFTGALTGNIEVYPVNASEKTWWLMNTTTGDFTLTFKTAAGTGFVVPRSTRISCASDGTNIRRLTSIVPAVQTFTASGTYTPTPGIHSVIVFGVAGGGGGGGVAGGDNQGGGGGGAGGAFIERYTPVTIGTSQVVTIGSSGLAGTAGNGGSGGTTSFGALASATGGGGGQGFAGAGVSSYRSAGTGGLGSGGDLSIAGGPGGIAQAEAGGVPSFSGFGGNSIFGGGGAAQIAAGGGAAGAAGGAYGGGGSGASTSLAALVGGPGATGVVYVLEF